VYRPAQALSRQTLVWVDREGREEPVGAPPRAYGNWPRLSPDGKRIAYFSADRGLDIWLWDVENHRETRFTTDPAMDAFPVWTPDGDRLIWSSGREGALNVYMQASDGTGTPERLTASPFIQRPTSVSPDGMSLAMMVDRPGRPMGLALVDLGTRKLSPLADFGKQCNFGDFHSNPEFSPDGRWLAYTSYKTGRLEVFVRPYPDVESGEWQVSSGGGQAPGASRARADLSRRRWCSHESRLGCRRSAIRGALAGENSRGTPIHSRGLPKLRHDGRRPPIPDGQGSR
jgi:Tol biopolymer transport system component